jgi:hypothetical protein
MHNECVQNEGVHAHFNMNACAHFNICLRSISTVFSALLFRAQTQTQTHAYPLKTHAHTVGLV